MMGNPTGANWGIFLCLPKAVGYMCFGACETVAYTSAKPAVASFSDVYVTAALNTYVWQWTICDSAMVL